MNQSIDKTAPLADIKTQPQTQVNYDQDLAVALGLATDINIDFKSDSKVEKIAPFLFLASNLVKEFQTEMLELGHKFRSATAKITALIFMPADLMASQYEYDSENKLQFSAILIEQPDLSPLADPLPPDSMIENSEDEIKRELETAQTKMALKKQLLWFQEFGRYGLINTTSATIVETTSPTEKTKRHLTLITDQVQAA
jgi:hypothetical protein